MTRFPDWPERLSTFIESRRKAVFSWGRQDCCLMAADWVLAATGEDPAAKYRGKYRDERGATRIIHKAGGLRALVPLQEVIVGTAQRGDVVLAVVAGRETLGIADVGGWWAPGEAGIAFRTMFDVVAAFRV